MTFIILFIIILALSAAIISFAAIYSLHKQIENIKTGIMQFSDGHLDYRLSIPDSPKIASLAEALNQMAKHFGDQMNTVTAQRNELEAVFSGMSEGVIVTDSSQRIIAINKTGAAILNTDAKVAIGRGIAEIIYNPELQELIREALEQKEAVEKEIVIYKDKKRHLQARGASVDTASGSRAVIVLNDITRIHQLENVRREFVSNVSHELKTPITSIKGFIETLLDGAINDPKEARKFLEIIAKHSDRLNAIIEDLLNLSRIEQEAESQSITIAEGPIHKVLMAAVAACQSKAQEKQISIDVDCDTAISSPINAQLLEQAIVNLIENSIRYSDPQKTIRIKAVHLNNEVVISVTDEGCGIDAEHLPRIFERFYVVDKARSRKLGGTGLGLAIVKHIVNAHGGKVSVESQLGKGSKFTITLLVDFGGV